MGKESEYIKTNLPMIDNFYSQDVYVDIWILHQLIWCYLILVALEVNN